MDRVKNGRYAAFVSNFPSLYPFRYTPDLLFPSSPLNRRLGTILARYGYLPTPYP